MPISKHQFNETPPSKPLTNLVFNCFRTGFRDGCSEHASEFLCSIKEGELLY